MSGEDKLSGVAQWARLRIDWVQAPLPLERARLPCGNTYHNVCNQIDLTALNQRLADLFASPSVEQSSEVEAPVVSTAVTESVVAETAVTESAVTESAVTKSGLAEPTVAEQPQTTAPALRQWALDGKTLRGSHRLAQGKQAQSTLGLYDLESRHVVAQRPLAGKGHERATALALVQELDLHGILLSADALHTHPAWCHCVRRQGGDYLLIAKTNQRTLHADITCLFSEQPRPWLPEQHARQVDQGHGRLTIRSLRTSSQLNDYLAPTWCAVAQVFQLQRVVHQRSRVTTESVYGLTSLNPAVTPPAQLLYHIRRYWEIENRLHWRRDVTLGEDACTASREQTPQVLAALNNAILALADRLQIANLVAQRRIFAARPDDALKLLLHPL
jgi:predicted transposase YbfD/YdcC